MSTEGAEATGRRAQRAHRILLHGRDWRGVEEQLVQRGHGLVRQQIAVRPEPLEADPSQWQHAQPHGHSVRRPLRCCGLALLRRGRHGLTLLHHRRLVFEQLKPEALWRQPQRGRECAQHVADQQHRLGRIGHRGLLALLALGWRAAALLAFVGSRRRRCLRLLRPLGRRCLRHRLSLGLGACRGPSLDAHLDLQRERRLGALELELPDVVHLAVAAPRPAEHEQRRWAGGNARVPRPRRRHHRRVRGELAPPLLTEVEGVKGVARPLHAARDARAPGRRSLRPRGWRLARRPWDPTAEAQELLTAAHEGVAPYREVGHVLGRRHSRRHRGRARLSFHQGHDAERHALRTQRRKMARGGI